LDEEHDNALLPPFLNGNRHSIIDLIRKLHEVAYVCRNCQ